MANIGNPFSALVGPGGMFSGGAGGGRVASQGYGGFPMAPAMARPYGSTYPPKSASVPNVNIRMKQGNTHNKFNPETKQYEFSEQGRIALKKAPEQTREMAQKANADGYNVYIHKDGSVSIEMPFTKKVDGKVYEGFERMKATTKPELYNILGY